MSRTNGPDSSPAFLLHKEGYTIQDYRLIARIGEGSFGEVWKAERGGFPVALKILKTSMTSDETQRELKSLETLRKLHHQFLLHTDNFWSDGDRLFIEMELADGGTLKERLKAYQAAGKPGIPEEEVLKHFTEMAKALDYLHGHRPVFLHRDIKPANILLVQGCAKLADFGLLRQVAGDNSSTKTQGGTFPYMAPESIASDVFSVYTDLFAFAVTYAELRQGELPFSGKNQYQICDKILRDPPALSDLFHPDEKEVLLKALAKDPRKRYASCGEFVFELKRAVPWTPAVDLVALAAPTQPESSGLAKGTDPVQPSLTDPGTQRKRAPATMQEIDLPSAEGPPAADGTVIRQAARAAAVTKPPPVQPEPVQEAARPVTAPLPAYAPPRPKLPARALLGAALMVVGIAGLTGVWFLLSRAEQDEVRDLVAKHKFAEAALQVKTANRFLLPSRDALQKEIEEKWWSELKEPGADEDPQTCKRSIRELDKFAEAFPGHDGVKARRAKYQALLADAVAGEVDRMLHAGKIAAAREFLAQNDEFLPERGKALQGLIDNKQEVLAVLKGAREKLRKDDFEGSLGLLDAARVPFLHKEDLDEKKQIQDAAKSGLQKLLAKDPIAKAWAPLLADIVVVEECRRRLNEFKEYVSQAPSVDPLHEKNVRALESLVSAHESGKDGWNKASEALTALVRDNNQAGALNRNLWAGLAQLEKNRALFRYEDLDALPNAPDEPARKAASLLFAHALERLLKKDNYQWLPDMAAAAKCAMWCEERISAPGASILAFHAECLIESGAAVEKINQIVQPPRTDWYASYVDALVKEKNQKRADAADIVAGIVKENAKAVEPGGRRKSAARILRSAVAEFKRKGRELVEQKDAVKAVSWLTAVLVLEESPPVDDLVNLAFAAVKGEPKDADKLLELVEQRLSKLAAADKAKGYFGLGGAYRADLELAGRGMDQALARSGRAQKFALRWRSMDLENAAELNAKAVDLEALAAYAKSKSGEEMQRVFARALAKADENPADGFAVPLVVAKLQFAWSETCPTIHLKETIAEGEAALKSAATAEESSKSMKDWWAVLRCRGMVRLADVRLRSLKARYAAKDINDDEVAGELGRARNLYEDARTRGKYPELWNGELSGNIGAVNYHLGNYEAAAREMTASLKGLDTLLNTTPRPYPPEIEPELKRSREVLEDTLKKALEKLKQPN